MTAPPLNGDAQELIRQVDTASARLRRVELVLVAVTCVAAVVGVGFSVSASARTRRLGAVIADCTTKGGKCYEENRVSALEYRQTVLGALAELRLAILDSASCQTLQILQHRDANERAHQDEAAHHGYAYAAPETETPPPIPDQLKDACKKFVPSNLGGEKKP